jgi:hypothetical protein
MIWAGDFSYCFAKVAITAFSNSTSLGVAISRLTYDVAPMGENTETFIPWLRAVKDNVSTTEVSRPSCNPPAGGGIAAAAAQAAALKRKQLKSTSNQEEDNASTTEVSRPSCNPLAGGGIAAAAAQAALKRVTRNNRVLPLDFISSSK